jgi:hypothetical protein
LASADDNQNATAKKATKSADQSGYSEKKAKAGEPFAAKLIRLDAQKEELSVEVTLKIPQENKGELQNIANLRAQLVGNRDINSVRNIYLQIAQHEQRLITFKEEHKKLELTLNGDTKIRTLLLPVEYDDKGKLRKLTPKELKDLKGPDSRLPGYTADPDALKPNQQVKVYLVKAKHSAKPSSKENPDEPKDKAKVAIVVILSEPAK